MTINLSTYSAIQTALFCKIIVPNFQTFAFSNLNRNFILNNLTYTGLGELMNITDSTSELRVSANEIVVTISGIENNMIANVLDYKFKGSSIEIIRGIFDATTGQLLSIAGNPVGKFKGIINNFSLNEDWSGTDATNTIGFSCTSVVGLLKNKVAGRRTNPEDQKYFYPTDLSMDRVPNLANSNYNFGAVIR